MMNMENIEKVLVTRGYAPKQAAAIVPDLQKMDVRLKKLLNEWIVSAKETDYAAEGISISSLMKKYKLYYPAALLTIDWLLREPEKAKTAIKRGIR